MTGQEIIVPAQFLFDRQAEWNPGCRLHGPAAIAGGLPQEVLASSEVIVTGSELDPALVGAMPSLRLVACFTTGFEGIDAEALARRGIALTTAAGVNAHDVADHAMALFLGCWHGLRAADAAVREGDWEGYRRVAGPRRSLRGKRAGIAGLGRIGMEIARRAEAHGMDVRWWGPRPKAGERWPRAESLRALAECSDALFIALRATEENAGIVDDAVLSALGPTGIVVNVARGSLVDEDALRASLESGRLGGAALDVFASEPVPPAAWESLSDKVLLTPHVAGFTQEAGRDMFGQLRENLRRHFAGEPLLTPNRDA